MGPSVGPVIVVINAISVDPGMAMSQFFMWLSQLPQ